MQLNRKSITSSYQSNFLMTAQGGFTSDKNRFQKVSVFYDNSKNIYNVVRLFETQSKKVKTFTNCFTSADNQEVSELKTKVSLIENRELNIRIEANFDFQFRYLLMIC